MTYWLAQGNGRRFRCTYASISPLIQATPPSHRWRLADGGRLTLIVGSWVFTQESGDVAP